MLLGALATYGFNSKAQKKKSMMLIYPVAFATCSDVIYFC